MRDTLDNTTVKHFRCEVCGIEKSMTDLEAYDEGWDYPPFVGAYGVLSPRTCGDMNCIIDKTAWWAIVCEGMSGDDLLPEHKATVQRILAETEGKAS